MLNDFDASLLSDIQLRWHYRDVLGRRDLDEKELLSFKLLNERLLPYDTEKFLIDTIHMQEANLTNHSTRTLQVLVSALKKILNSKEFEYIKSVIERAKTENYIKDLRGES